MQRHPAHLVTQARRIVTTEGLSYKEVAKRLNVSHASVSIWCSGLSGTKWESLIRKNQLQRKSLVDSEIENLHLVKFTQSNAKIYSAILYGCEGAKYPASNHLALTNSDPSLIACFVTLLRKSFALDESKWRALLQIHTDQDYSYLANYWSGLVSIPLKQFYKPTITSPNGKKHRNDYRGTCTVKYYDVKIQIKLIGIFNEFMRKSLLQGGVA